MYGRSVDGARVVEDAQCIGAAVKLDVDRRHLMAPPSLERLFEPEPTPDINPDPIAQTLRGAAITAVK
jgi:hypothetical protein